MNFEELTDILKKDQKDAARVFGDYYMEKYINHGQQGMVIKVKNAINKRFALKFFKPKADESPLIIKEGLNSFKREVETLATLNHKNIVKIYVGGIAKWDLDIKKWVNHIGFPKELPNQLPENSFAFYIMDYIDGLDLDEIFPEFGTVNPDDIAYSKSERLALFEKLVSQISTAMYYYSQKGFIHKDIKPSNIRFRKEDETFVVVDFGFARHLKSEDKAGHIVRTEFLDQKSIEKEDYEKNDMGQFCLVLGKIIPSFENEYKKNRYHGMTEALHKGSGELKNRFDNMNKFYYTIKQYFLSDSGWKLQLKNDEFMTSSGFGRFSPVIRIPSIGSILLTKELIDIIDTPEFQRLRGIRQLGTASFIYPGANHTRFEHSLGTCFLSLKYLEKLLGYSAFRMLVEPIEQTTKQIVLASLLHDIGHYPYSHWVEEIDEFPDGTRFLDHEDRATKIITSSKIGELIEKTWKVNVQVVCDLIAGKGIEEDNTLQYSFISSIIDVDKIDYLVRDGIHCGVNYGKGIDIERFLDSLYIDTQSKKLCLTEKGRSVLLSVLTCRNIMYNQVYWHKTVRAGNAMFKRFFYEFVTRKLSSSDELTAFFDLSEDHFVSTLHKKAVDSGNEKLSELIAPFALKGHSFLFKPAYIYFYRDSTETHNIQRFFNKLLTLSYSRRTELSNKLVESLKSYIPEIGHLDIILELTPIREEHEQSHLKGFRIWNSKKEIYEPYDTAGIIDGLNDYLNKNKQAYIFCNPQVYPTMKELASSGKLSKIIGEL